MQETVVARETRRRLPALMAALFGDDRRLEIQDFTDSSADLVMRDDTGWLVLIQVKASSRPDQVASAAEALARDADEGDGLLVVPYMSAGGAAKADELEINWLDLSGNARIRTPNFYVRVEGRPRLPKSRGRPATPFGPSGARVTRALLLDPDRWWRQKDLADVTGLNNGSVSRIVRRLGADGLLAYEGRAVRPRDPGLLLDGWAADYRFDAHDIVACHITGSGFDLARELAERLVDEQVRHAFTGLPAAWALDRHAAFRLTSVYVDDDPRRIAERLDVRLVEKGANVQLIGPDDVGVFIGEDEHNGLRCVAPVQIYLDLQHLPERAGEAAQHLRARHLKDEHAPTPQAP